jgi:hypothetical protein
MLQLKAHEYHEVVLIAKMQEPKDTVHHNSGKLDEEGLSEEWMTV